jgi:hypothetical protein
MKHEDKIKQRIRSATRLTKPGPNTTVVRDYNGRPLFEMYAPKDKPISIG